MYEPRGHAAMSGAILQPPTRPDADWGVLYIEVRRLPADVRPRHDRRGDRARRDRHGRGHRARSPPIRLDTPAGLVVAEVAVRDGRAESRDASATSRRSSTALDVDRRGAGLRHGALRHGLRRQLLRDRRARRDRRPVRPGARPRADGRSAWRCMDAIEESAPPVHPASPGIHGCHHVQLVAPGSDAAALAARDGDPPRATSTARRAARARAPGWPSCTHRGLLGEGEELRNESLLGGHFTARVHEHDRGGRASPRSCRWSPAARGSAGRPSGSSTSPTRSPRASCSPDTTHDAGGMNTRRSAFWRHYARQISPHVQSWSPCPRGK